MSDTSQEIPSTNPKTVATPQLFASAITVQKLYDALRELDIPVTRVAKELGISRGYLTQMLNGKSPMRRIYALALRQLITIITRVRSERAAESAADSH